MPNMYARGILFGKMVIELGDTCTAKCEKLGMTADIEFKTKVHFPFALPFSASHSSFSWLARFPCFRTSRGSTGSNLFYVRCSLGRVSFLVFIMLLEGVYGTDRPTSGRLVGGGVMLWTSNQPEYVVLMHTYQSRLILRFIDQSEACVV